ncbi:MAG: hypothetical protein AAB461_03205 [Patescibacteria group bacterium]
MTKNKLLWLETLLKCNKEEPSKQDHNNLQQEICEEEENAIIIETEVAKGQP